MNTFRLSPRRCMAFRNKVYTYYKMHQRDLPWRTTTDPYHIMISEVMLQQTQVDRVIDKYHLFIKAFPTFSALAGSPLQRVLAVWQGMGYNRRALYLKKAAQIIVEQYKGVLPRSPETLRTLPGIGPATARSIAAYAFNAPVVFIETNIRTVFIHEFFPVRTTVSDNELLPLVEQTLDHTEPGRWYNALMDYGTMLKKKHPNPSRKSAHYAKQSPFESSDRKVRGLIIRFLTVHSTATERTIARNIPLSAERLHRCIAGLIKDGLVTKKNSVLGIAS